MGLQPAGRLPGSNQLDLVIGLNWRNTEALTNLLAQLYNPASANYRHYLQPGQFVESFGPSESDYAALLRFFVTNGFTVTGTHPNRALLDVRGPVAALERTFHCRMLLYPHPEEPRTFYSPDTDPSVDLDVPIRAVTGLDNFRIPHPKKLLMQPLVPPGAGTPNDGSGAGGSFQGYDFRAAYAPGVSLDGTGQSVGLFELNGYYTSDILAYETNAGLPKVTLTNVLIDGFDGIAIPNGNDIAEVSLDIEMAIAMAPGLTRVIVYEAKPGAYGADVLSRMATDNLASQLGCSWDFGIDQNTEGVFQEFAAQGQSFFAAAGDTGAYSGDIPTPSDDPYITIVGGTVLTTATNGSWQSETAWGQGSGGISATYPIPYWQQNVSMTNNMGSTTMRNIPDVAMTAANILVIHDQGATNVYGGTSFAAPLWAGFLALVNQQAAANGKPPAGFINPAIYALGTRSNYTALFHDITTGNSTNSGSPYAYFAVPGYDLCTGWGTPNGSNLISFLATPDPLNLTPAAGFSSTGPGGGPFNPVSTAFTLTNTGPNPVSWNVTGLPAWLNCSPTNGTMQPGGPAVTVTVSLNPAAGNLVAGNYTSTVEFHDQTDGYIQTRQFNLTVFASLVQNGGFETGSFSYWTLSGNTVGMQISPSPLDAHSGKYGAELGSYGSLGYLSQTAMTLPGQTYLLSLWLDSPDGRVPNEFAVSWNGAVLFDQVNIGMTGWTNLQFVVTATTTNTMLQLGGRDDHSYLGLDDISLQLITAPNLQPQAVLDQAVQVSAVLQTVPPVISLSWPPITNAVEYGIYRKSRDASSWGTVITNLGPAATNYADTNVATGIGYEYRIAKTDATYGGEGYIYCGINLPLVESRGTVVLIVDNTYTSNLVMELQRLQNDLTGDGWTVIRHDVGRTDSVASVKALITADYLADTNDVNTVFLFGHVPVPYAGDIYPDGPPDHEGAWPCDGYYGDMTGIWLDTTVNVTVASDPRNYNVPGDGKFDPDSPNTSHFPATLLLRAGRVDLSDLPSFALPEVELLRQYLNKDYNFRHKLITAQPRGIIDDNFGVGDGEAFAADGWRNFAAFFGASNTFTTSTWAATLSGQSYLWGYGCGPADYVLSQGLTSTAELAANDPQVVFTMFYGGYFGDWDTQNNLLRAPLATPTYTLTCAWAGRPHWQFHHMGLGETTGFSANVAQNNNGSLYTTSYANYLHIALMGDPTLRMHILAPPTGLGIITNTPGQTTLNWTPSSDGVAGYAVYGGPAIGGPFARLQSGLVLTNTYTDLIATSQVYMVRAVALQTSAGGSYTNISQGVFEDLQGDFSSPTLIISQTNGFVQLRWLAAAIGFQLETAGALSPPLWSVDPSPIQTDSVTNVVAEPLQPTSRFFRLARTTPP